MKAFIGRYYSTLEKAEKDAKEKNRMWRNKAFYVLKSKNGYFVVSGFQIRRLFPELRFEPN